MATSKGANTYNRQNWEQSDFPILCQTCLGDNPYIRMLKDKFGKECKICLRPFTIFKWCPGAKMRYKKTEICQTCSKIKNVCQTCLLDLEYGLPIEVRDKALAIQDNLPRSDVNKEYYLQNADKEMANTDGTVAGGGVGKAQATSDLLLKLARTTPYYKRNRPHICSFWVKGECKRGEECPYRHEMPNAPDDPLANQNIKDRFYGVNDPVADKMMRRAASMPKLEIPSDKSITTLYVGGIDERMKENDLREYFYQYGEIRSIVIASGKNCAFICYTTRQAAEFAAERSFNKVIIKGKRLKVLWGKSQEERNANRDATGADKVDHYAPVPGLPGALPPTTIEEPIMVEPPNLFDTPKADDAPPDVPLNIPINGPPPPRFQQFPPPQNMPPGPPGPPTHRPPPPNMMRHPNHHPNAPPMRFIPPPPMGFPPRMRTGGPPGPPPFGGQHFPPRPPPPFQGGNHRPPPLIQTNQSQVNKAGEGDQQVNGPPPPKQFVHYPSQDPHRMGTGKDGTSTI